MFELNSEKEYVPAPRLNSCIAGNDAVNVPAEDEVTVASPVKEPPLEASTRLYSVLGISPVPIGTLCSGNQTTWSSCPIPQPSGITSGQLIWESATSNGALSSNGTINNSP